MFDEGRRRNVLRTGIFGVVVTVCAMLAAVGFHDLPIFAQGRYYTAYFVDASGVTPGSDVTVSGIKVGKVNDVQLVRGSAMVRFTVDRTVHVGDQSLASIRSDTVLGDKSVAIKPAGDGISMTFPLDRTSTPYTLSSALQDLGKTGADIDERQLTQALGVLTDSLHDATPDLRAALDGVADLSATLNANDGAIAGLLTHADGVTSVLAHRADQINKVVVDGEQLFHSLDERRDAISALIQGIGPVSQQLSGFVADNQREFGPTLKELNAVLDDLLARKEHLSKALKLLPSYSTTLGEVVASAPGFQVNLYGNPPPAIGEVLLDSYFQPGKLPDSLADLLRGQIQQRIIIRPKSP